MDQGLFLEELYRSVQEYNILPLTSACSLNCIFCSHRFQPGEVTTYAPGHISTEIILDLLDYLDNSQKIVIGEAVSRIEEGEPFLHPDWEKIFTRLRRQYPHNLLQITTSGTELSPDDIDFLSRLRPLKLFLSLNVFTPKYRSRLLGDKEPKKIQIVLEYLSRNDLAVEGSLVALPKLTGWQELYQSLKFLDSYACVRAVRMIVPGYTGRAGKILQQKLDLSINELKQKIASWQSDFSLLIYPEPAPVEDLRAKIMGVISASPAEKAGLQRGDIIKEIKGKKPFSRVEAFKLVKKSFAHSEKFTMRLGRGNNSDQVEPSQQKEITLQICPDEIKSDFEYYREWSPGIVMAYDLPAEYYEKILAISPAEGRVLLIAAPRAEKRLQLLLDKLVAGTDSCLDFDLMIIKPEFFAGNINCSGLLVCSDILKYRQKIAELDPDLILLPDIMFNHREQDLTAQRVKRLKNQLPAPVEII